ncbi:MAG: hypothetical protein DMG13_24405 [Acidobacteria bacterium]|nr:MAG: hypothetical protein DMG13_24405 [Acidobacteriota bacterium]
MLKLPEFRVFVRPRGVMDPAEAERVESGLAAGRAILAVAAGIGIYVDPAGPLQHQFLVNSLALIYVFYSVGALVFPSWRKQAVRHPVTVYAVDVAWLALLNSFTEDQNSPFFVFFIFALVSAAYRWGARETLVTGILLSVFSLWLGRSDLLFFIPRLAYVLITGMVLGYLAHAEKRLRAETSLIARAMGKAQAEFTLTQVMASVLEEIRQFYAATAVIVAVVEKRSGRAYVAICKPPADKPHQLQITELSPLAKTIYLFASDAHAWHMARSKQKRFTVFATGEDGQQLGHIEIPLEEAFLRAHPFESLFGVAISSGEELSGRLYVLDPQLQRSREAELAFICKLARQVTPAVYNVYLWRRHKAHVGATERARIACDLHDGVVQSLTGLALHLEAERNERDSQKQRELLSSIPALIRSEIHNLRELIDQLTSVDLRPGELVPFLVEFVEKFQRDTAISAKLVLESEDVALPSRVCREIAGIVREALANVRKHSYAHHVLVRFSSQRGRWNLVIDDDGRGFDFSGTLSLAELDAIHKGPRTIKERVRLLKGQLTIESRPGAGSRLTISAPLKL